MGRVADGLTYRIVHFRYNWTLILATSVLASFGALYYFDAWFVIGLPSSYVPAFVDWHGVVAASDCAKQGFNVYFENPCDALNRVHNYGSLWLKVSSLGLTRENQWTTGLIISLSFLIAASLTLRPRSFGNFAFGLAAIDAPAVMFGAEQSNVDLVIFILLLATMFLFSRADRGYQVFAIALCILLTLLKFYPAAAIVLIFWTLPSIRSLVVACIIFAFAMLTWAIVDYDNLRVVYSVIQKPGIGSNVAIGSSLIFAAMKTVFPSSLAWLSGTWASMASFFVLLIASLYCGSRIQRHFIGSSRIDIEKLQFIGGSAIIVFAFFAITNFDYRCVFMLLLIPLLMRSCAKRHGGAEGERLVATVTLGLVLVVLWSTGIVNLINNSPEHRSTLVLVMKYLASWVLVFMLMMINAAFVFRRWNELAGRRTDIDPVATAATRP